MIVQFFTDTMEVNLKEYYLHMLMISSGQEQAGFMLMLQIIFGSNLCLVKRREKCSNTWVYKFNKVQMALKSIRKIMLKKLKW